MDSGVLVDVETSVNIRYGYDIRGEVVGEDGTVALAESAGRTVPETYGGRVPEDWRERFIAAYDVEFQEWIDGVAGWHHRAVGLGRVRRRGHVRRRVGRAALGRARAGAPGEKPALYK